MSDIYYDTYNEGEAPEEEKSKLSKILSLIWENRFGFARLHRVLSDFLPDL